jgi:ZIP family zinc transporter
MADKLLAILPIILMAGGAGILAGVLAKFLDLGLKARSAVQHFAAGAVLAAVATGVIPEAQKSGGLPGVLGGFAAGGLVMIALKWAVLQYERRARRKGTQKAAQGKGQPAQSQPVGLSVAAALDTLLDGAIISAGFSSGSQLGTLLAVALAVELFFLNLSVGSEHRQGQSKGWRGVLITSGIALLLPVGALLGTLALSGASPATVAIVLAFGAATLIYLVAEELLVESIEAEDSLFSTATLFTGFLVLLALKMFTDRSGG